MKRYYFHQRIDGQVLIDPDGFDYPDPAAARASALLSARSLWATAILTGEDLRGQVIEIANDDGVAIDVVPFEDALPAFLRRSLGSS